MDIKRELEITYEAIINNNNIDFESRLQALKLIVEYEQLRRDEYYQALLTMEKITGE